MTWSQGFHFYSLCWLSRSGSLYLGKPLDSEGSYLGCNYLSSKMSIWIPHWSRFYGSSSCDWPFLLLQNTSPQSIEDNHFFRPGDGFPFISYEPVGQLSDLVHCFSWHNCCHMTSCSLEIIAHYLPPDGEVRNTYLEFNYQFMKIKLVMAKIGLTKCCYMISFFMKIKFH